MATTWLAQTSQWRNGLLTDGPNTASVYPGDPTTSGYVSRPDSPRADRGKILPSIPSLPISWIEAQPILQALNGFGTPTERKLIEQNGWVPSPALLTAQEQALVQN